MATEPCYDIAHLGHVELFTPVIEESYTFFRDILGMEEVAREGRSVICAAWAIMRCIRSF